VIPIEVFGGNSDGSVAMFEWLDAMCPGCRHAFWPNGRSEQVSCRRGYDSRALFRPRDDIVAWSPDAASRARDEFPDEEVTEIAWCMDRVQRARRSDAGRRRPRPQPIPPGQEVLL